MTECDNFIIFGASYFKLDHVTVKFTKVIARQLPWNWNLRNELKKYFVKEPLRALYNKNLCTLNVYFTAVSNYLQNINRFYFAHLLKLWKSLKIRHTLHNCLFYKQGLVICCWRSYFEIICERPWPCLLDGDYKNAEQ